MDNDYNDTNVYLESSEEKNIGDEFFRDSVSPVIAIIFYFLAYLYARSVIVGEGGGFVLTLFVAGFTACCEVIYRKRERSKESMFLLACLWFITLFYCFGSCRIWDQDKPLLFMHVLAVWWVMSRSGVLLEGKSDHLIVLDAFYGFVSFPFTGLFLRIKTIFKGLKNLESRKNKGFLSRIIWSLVAVIAAIFLFCISTSLLSDADDRFGSLIGDMLDSIFLALMPDDNFIFSLFFSFPVGAYLFGLAGKCAIETPENRAKKSHKINDILSTMGKVPAGVWILLLAGFSLLYLAFFCTQGSYLFGAFTGTLPDGFSFSSYAVSGFSELCKVMSINFLLLWLVLRLADRDVSRNNLLKVAVCVIVAESILLSVIALSKILLYISIYGFTPKRIQSIWLVSVLLSGCISILVWLFTGKKCFRSWLYLGTATLTLLHIY